MTEDFDGLSQAAGISTAEIVSAYVSNNHVALADLPALIACVQDALAGLSNGQPIVVAEAKATDAQIRKSIRRDALISFINGKGYKALKRHLTSHGIDADTYRQRYGLPADYPMVSPTYSARRSEISKDIISRSRTR